MSRKAAKDASRFMGLLLTDERDLGDWPGRKVQLASRRSAEGKQKGKSGTNGGFKAVRFDDLDWHQGGNMRSYRWSNRICRRARGANVRGSRRFQKILAKMGLCPDESNGEEQDQKLHFRLSQMHVFNKTELRQERLRGQEVRGQNFGVATDRWNSASKEPRCSVVSN